MRNNKAEYYKELLNTTKDVEVTYTPRAFKQAIERAKGEGHKLIGILWNGADFEDLIIIREYE